MGFLTVLHIFVALILILLVLVQDSKGAMGSTFGGSSSGTLFGATGADNILTKMTKGFVVLFALTCILLTRLSAQNKESVLDVVGPGEQETTENVDTNMDTSLDTSVTATTSSTSTT